MSTDARILSRGWYFGEVRSDPKNPDLVYVSNVSLYRSTDGGKNFKAIRGAPGGDDYHSLWIDPENPRRMISGVDQGTIVTLNGGVPGAPGTTNQRRSFITWQWTTSFPTGSMARNRTVAPWRS